jgi:hypothetical protein
MVFIIVGLIGGAVVWWLTRARPQAVLADSLENFLAAETFAVRSELDLDLPLTLQGRPRPLNKVAVIIGGDMRRGEEGVQEFAGTVRAEARGSGVVLFTAGNLTVLKDRVIFKLDDFPALLNPSGSLIGKWTHVETPVFTTHNPEAIQEVVGELISHLQYVGKDAVPGKESEGGYAHFYGQLEGERAVRLAHVLDERSSGNKTLNIIARLLYSFELRGIDVWVDRPSRSVAAVQLAFAAPEEAASGRGATLRVAFSDYGKLVTVDTPPQERRVRPEVFAPLFNQGRLQPQ